MLFMGVSWNVYLEEDGSGALGLGTREWGRGKMEMRKPIRRMKCIKTTRERAVDIAPSTLRWKWGGAG